MQRFHHWLIASKKNKFHPKLLEPVGLVVIALFLALLPFVYNVSNGSTQVLGYATDISSGGLNAATNAHRSSNNLSQLSINGQLQTAAQNKAAHMFAQQYWAHTAPDGTTPWSFIAASGYVYVTAGENLAKNFLTSSGVVNAWMNSAGHRANLLNGQFSEVGYGIQNGVLEGQEVTLVVAMYGAPKTQSPPPAAPVTPAPAPPAASTPKAAPAPQTTAPAPTPTEPTTTQPTTPNEELTVTAEEEATPVSETPVQASPAKIDESVPVTETQTAAIMGVQSLAPVQAYMGLNWAQRTSLFIIASLAVLFVMKHTVIWRHQRRGIKAIWLKSHPLAQSALLGLVVVILLMTGTGTIL